MVEYFTEAVVLDRAPRGESDELITLYTRSLGKVMAVAKSSRMPLSKLSGHLRVGLLIKTRIIKTSRFKLIDAMSENVQFNSQLLNFIKFIDQMTSLESPDPHLWQGIDFVMRNIGGQSEENYMPRVYRRFLDIFGYGAKFAKCDDCGTNKIAYFLPSDIIFLCADSLTKRGLNETEAVSLQKT